jgi:uncharacterized membrane protein YwzB
MGWLLEVVAIVMLTHVVLIGLIYWVVQQFRG